MKRGDSGLCGVLAIDKPAGLTSHDVINRVRRLTGERRVGHAGTLDPSATGLMLVGVGAATRLCTYLSGHDKAYLARFAFGVATDTDDAEGRALENRSAGLQEALDAFYRLDAERTVAGLVGTMDQLPPAYSAIKKSGVVAYRAAREGKKLNLESRRVAIYDTQFLSSGVAEYEFSCMDGSSFCAELPWWDLVLEVSKGTYIRSIARDLGNSIGCGAHLAELRRIRIADFSLKDACTLEELEACVSSGAAFPWCNPTKLLGFPVVELSQQQKADVSCGRNICSDKRGERISCVADGRLWAIYEQAGESFHAATVIPGGVAGVY